MSNFINDIIKNANDLIKYKNTVTTGEITVDNGDGTYDVKIANASSAYPNVETVLYGEVFSIGEIVDIIFEYGCKEAPKIIGHAKKIKQEPKIVEVDYSGGVRAITLGSYAITEISAYLEGEIKLNGASNCTIRGFKYGLTTAYGSDTHDDGSYGEGTFSKQITGLTENTTYHFQAYVLDANGDEQVGEDKTLKTEGYTLYEYNTGAEPSSWPYINATNKKMMQSFTATSGHYVDKISIIIGRRNANNLGTITLGVYGVDGGGLPTGVVLTSGIVDGNTIPDWGTETYVDFIVTQIPITNGIQYAIVISCDAYGSSQWLEWGEATDAYAGGKFDRYNGATWENYGSGNSDGRFKVYGK